jgi:hypothetical protein
MSLLITKEDALLPSSAPRDINLIIQFWDGIYHQLERINDTTQRCQCATEELTA